jgi:hypothetical protein
MAACIGGGQLRNCNEHRRRGGKALDKDSDKGVDVFVIGADFARAEALTTWCSKPWAAAQLQKDRG